jgi:hypothetical protein
MARRGLRKNQILGGESLLVIQKAEAEARLDKQVR